jgi:hypothetical protein
MKKRKDGISKLVLFSKIRPVYSYRFCDFSQRNDSGQNAKQRKWALTLYSRSTLTSSDSLLLPRSRKTSLPYQIAENLLSKNIKSRTGINNLINVYDGFVSA